MNNNKGPSKTILLAIGGLLALSVAAGCSSSETAPDPEATEFLEDLKEYETQAAEGCEKLDGPDAPIPTEVGDEAHELNQLLAQCPEKWGTPSGQALWGLGFANGDGVYHEDYR